VHPIQPVKIFGNVFTPFGTLTFTENFTEIVPMGTPPSEGLERKRVAKYSEFRPIEGYISETVQDMR